MLAKHRKEAEGTAAGVADLDEPKPARLAERAQGGGREMVDVLELQQQEVPGIQAEIRHLAHQYPVFLERPVAGTEEFRDFRDVLEHVVVRQHVDRSRRDVLNALEVGRGVVRHFHVEYRAEQPRALLVERLGPVAADLEEDARRCPIPFEHRHPALDRIRRRDRFAA